MRTIFTLALLSVPFAVVAEEAVETSGDSTLTTMLIGAAITLVIAAIGWLAAKFGLRQTPPETVSPIDMTTSEGRRRFLDERLVPVIISNGKQWLITQIPVLITDAMDGDGVFHWRDHLNGLRAYVRKRAVDKFKAESINLVDYLGTSKELDDLIDRKLMELIGKLPDTLQPYLPAERIDWLTDQLRKFLVEEGRELLTQ